MRNSSIILLACLFVLSGCSSGKQTQPTQDKPKALESIDIKTQKLTTKLDTEEAKTILTKDVDLEQSSTAFQALIDKKDTQTLSSLAYNLDTPSESRDMAIWALGKIKPFPAEAHLSLVHSLASRTKEKNLNWRISRIIGDNFKKYASEKDIEKLTPFITQESVQYIEIGLTIIERIGPKAKKAIPTLISLLERESKRKKGASLNLIGSTLSAMGSAAIQPTIAHFSKSTSGRVRLRLVRVWIKNKAKGAIPTAKEYLLSGSAEKDRGHFVLPETILFLFKVKGIDSDLIDPLIKLIPTQHLVDDAFRTLTNEKDIERIKNIALDTKQTKEVRDVAIDVLDAYEGKEEMAFEVVEHILTTKEKVEVNKPLKRTAAYTLSTLSFKTSRDILLKLLKNSDNPNIPKDNIIDAHCSRYTIENFKEIPTPLVTQLFALFKETEIKGHTHTEVELKTLECLKVLSLKFPKEMMPLIFDRLFQSKSQRSMARLISSLHPNAIYGLPLLMEKISQETPLPISFTPLSKLGLPFASIAGAIETASTSDNVKPKNKRLAKLALQYLSEDKIDEAVANFLSSPGSNSEKRILIEYGTLLSFENVKKLHSEFKIINPEEKAKRNSFEDVLAGIAKSRTDMIETLTKAKLGWKNEKLKEEADSFLTSLKEQQEWLAKQLTTKAFVKDGFLTNEWKILSKTGDSAIPATRDFLKKPDINDDKKSEFSALSFLTRKSLHTEQIIPTLVGTLKSSPHKNNKYWATVILSNQGKPGIDTLIELLKNESAEIRLVCLRRLQKKATEYYAPKDLQTKIQQAIKEIEPSESNLWVQKKIDYCLHGDPTKVKQGSS